MLHRKFAEEFKPQPPIYVPPLLPKSQKQVEGAYRQSWSLLPGCDCAGKEAKAQAVHLQDLKRGD